MRIWNRRHTRVSIHSMHVTGYAPVHAHTCNRPYLCVYAMGCAHVCSRNPARHVGVCTRARTHTRTYDTCSRVHRCAPASLPVDAKRSRRDRVTAPSPGRVLAQACAASSSVSSQPAVTSRRSPRSPPAAARGHLPRGRAERFGFCFSASGGLRQKPRPRAHAPRYGPGTPWTLLWPGPGLRQGPGATPWSPGGGHAADSRSLRERGEQNK